MPDDHDDFYVAYLPTPPRVRQFVCAAAVSIAAAAAGLALLVAAKQRDPGDGVWDLGHPTTIEGRFVASPYPAIETSDGTIQLVGEGKRAAALPQSDLAGLRVRANGSMIRRGELRLLELVGEIERIALPLVATPP